MKLLSLFFIIAITCGAADRPIQPGADAKRATAAVAFPKCIQNAREVENILTTMKQNTDNKHKYDGYRKALENDSDLQLVARLIYTETLAANCGHQMKTVLPLIAGVINNRIRIRNGDIKSVVFERNQFASSLNNYSSSKYMDFLCPTDADVWPMAVDHADKPLNTLSPFAVNYFLYKHHPGWNKEPWKLPETSLSQTSKVRDCIRVFENKMWK